MQKIKITFWAATAIISLLMVNSAYMCFASPLMKASIGHLGFPDYFRIELGITKLLGVLALIIPSVPKKVKEFAYAGFFIMFTSGILAHFLMGDPVYMPILGLIALAVLITSYLSFQKSV